MTRDGGSRFDLCSVCAVPRFAHSWWIYRVRSHGLPFREPFSGSPRLRWRTLWRTLAP